MLEKILKKPFSFRRWNTFTPFVCLRKYIKLSSLFPNTFSITPDPLGTSESTGSHNLDGGSKTVSSALLRKGNMIYAAAPGVFALSHLMNRSHEKLMRVINQEMTAIGAQKLSLPVLGSHEMWRKSGRWELMGAELLKLIDRNEKAYCLSPTHEEIITSIVASHSPLTYRQYPIKLYQIGRKFRDEGRPKNGLLRCREFEMKDLYTFDTNEDEAYKTYSAVTAAYHKIFNRLNLSYVRVEATCGAMGGFASHEFHVLAPAGEDKLCQCMSCGEWFNKEFLESEENVDTHQHDHCRHENLNFAAGIEIAHTFLLGKKYSTIFKANFTNSKGKRDAATMGCYGIGVTRLLASILEANADTTRIQWPQLLAPYHVVIIPQKCGYKSDVTFALAQTLAADISSLSNMRNEVVLDDRLSLSIGKRVAEVKQRGIPKIIAVGKSALQDEPHFEVIDTFKDSCNFLTHSDTLSFLKTEETLVLDCL